MNSVCKFSFSRLLIVFALTLIPYMAGTPALAQGLPSDPSVDNGTHWYGTYDGVHENISLSSGNLSFCIPLVSVKGPNNHDLTIPLCYNSNFQEASTLGQAFSVAEIVSYFPWAWAPNTPSGYTTPPLGVGWALTGAPAYYGSVATTGGYPVEFMPDGSKYSFAPGVYAQPDAQNADIWLNNNGIGIGQTLIMKDGTQYIVSGAGSSSCPSMGCAKEMFPDQTTINWTKTSVTDAIGRTVTESSGSAFTGSSTTSSTAYVQFQYPDPVSTGSTRAVLVQMQTMQFNCMPGENSGPYGETGSVGLYSMPTAIILANGLTYTFQYDNCGALRKVTYPTGGYTRYDYSAQQLTYHCQGCNAGPFGYYVNEVSAKHICPVPAMTLGSTAASAFSSSNQCPVAEQTTTYTPTVYGYNQFDGTAGGNQQMIVTDPVGNSVDYQFLQGGLPMPDYTAPSVETSRQYYDASGKLWKTVATQYTSSLTTDTAPGSTFNYTGPGTGDIPPVLPTIQTTTLDNGMTSQIQWSYDVWQADLNDSVITEERVYDYGQGAPGPLLKRTDYTWLHRVNPSTYGWPAGDGSGGHHVCDKKSSETVYDGSGKMLEQTTYNYDGSGGIAGSLGLLTSKTIWRNTDGALLTTTYVYGQYGNVTKMTDPNGNITLYSYTDNYADGTNRSSNAFLTKTTDALGHVTQNQYYWGSGLVAGSCGENFSGTCEAGLTSGADYASYTYDLMGRKTSTTTGDGGKTTNCYSDLGGTGCSAESYPLQVTTTEAISSGVVKVSTSVAMHPINGLPAETSELLSDPSCPGGTVNVDTIYDADGRKSTVTNPYCSTNTSAPTSGTATYTYDGLSRIKQITHPDGTSATSTYTGRAELSADEGNGTHNLQRISQTDALGRLIYVCELTGQTQQGNSNNTPSSCGLDVSGTGFLTIYGYDASNSYGPLDSLTNVTQGGVTRSFIYDSLGELRSATNPESGTTTYTYDNDGNLTSKTDAKNIVTTYSYDTLNRLTGKSYSDGTTPSACFEYDQNASGRGVGRLTTEWTQMGICSSTPPSSGILTQRIFGAYDPLGRVTSDEQCAAIGNCTGGSAYTLTYSYDLAGDVTSFNNGLGGTSALSFTGQYNSAGRLTTLNGLQSAGASQTTPLFEATSYTPSGALANAQIGVGANDSGISFHRDYNSRLLPVDEVDTVGHTPGTATVQITGSEQSVGGGSAQYPNVLTFAGSDQNGQTGMYTIAVYAVAGGPPVALVNLSWNSSSTPSSLATTLSGSMLSCMTSTTYGVTVVGSSVYVANCRPGNQYYFAPSLDYYSTGSGPDFTATTNASGGGTYDTGTVALIVNGSRVASASYGQGSTPASIAGALVSNGANNGLVTLSANGSSITMTAIGGGTITDYSYQIQISTSQPSIFTSPSFSASSTSGSLTGGTNAPLYNWTINSYAPNGDVLAMTDSVMGTWSYSYDDFNRLTSGSATAGVDSGLTLGWTYDRYGNRWAQNASGTGSGSAVQPQLTFYGSNGMNNNRADGWSYDADGNLLNDGRNSYVYDAEGRVVTLNGAQTYIYDAEGRRVAKYLGGSISSIYLLGLGGEQVTELTSSGGWKHSNVFAGPRLLATYEGPNGTTTAGYHFHLSDWLGTNRMQTNASGNQEETCTSYPFGDGLNCTGTSADATEQHFTGKERDSESGLDYFFARYYSSNLGRFMTPDWAAKPTAVPYASFGDPQTLNLYAYVNNNPNTGIDLDGHVDPQKFIDCRKLPNNPISRVSAETKAEIRAGVSDTGKKTSDDKHGGSHEESGLSWTPPGGKEVQARAVPGPYHDVTQPGNATSNPYKAADPSKALPAGTKPNVVWHTHPSATAEVSSNNQGSATAPGGVTFGGTTIVDSFKQSPTTASDGPGNDIAGAASDPTVNLEIGTGDNTVYAFTPQGVTCSEKLGDFYKPQ